MSNFEDLFDSVMSGAKKAINVAGQKTTELVGMGKLKYQEQTLAKDLSKAYAKLGALVYEGRINDEDLSVLIDETIEEISQLNSQIDGISDEMKEAVEDFKSAPVATGVAHETEIDLSDYKDDVVDIAEDVKEDVKDTAEEIKDNVVEIKDDAVAETKHVAKDVKKKAHEVKGHAKAKADDLAEEVSDTVKEIKENLKD